MKNLGLTSQTVAGPALAGSAGPNPALRLLVLEDNPLIAWQLAEDLTSLGQVVCGPFTTLEAARAWEGPLDGAIVDIGIGSELSFAFVARLIEQGLAVVFYTGSAGNAVAGGLSHVPRCAKPAPAGQLLHMIRSQLSRHRAAERDILVRLTEWRQMARTLCGDGLVADQLLEIALERTIILYEENAICDEDPQVLLQLELEALLAERRSRRLA